jgi:hypothetical protein
MVTVRAEAARRIRERYRVNLNIGTIKSRMAVFPRASANNLRTAVRLRGRRLNLIEFSAKQTADGVRVQVIRGGKAVVIPHAFIRASRAGYRAVWLRSTIESRNSSRPVFRNKRSKWGPNSWGSPDMPIAFLRSLSLPQALRSPEVLNEIYKTAGEVFARNFRAEYKFQLSRR